MSGQRHSPLGERKIQSAQTDKVSGDDAFALAALATLGSAVFGQYAQDISQWVVCAHSEIKGDGECSVRAQAEALMVGTLLATMTAVIGTAAVAREGARSPRAATLMIVGALGGALFALLKAGAKGATYPQLELITKPLYIYVCCVLLFAFPPIWLHRTPQDYSRILEFYRRVAAAILIGAALGYSTQLVSEIAWTGWENWGAAKFFVAPSATVIAMGTWGVASLDPWLRPLVWTDRRRVGFLWLASFAIAAIFLAAGYGALFLERPGLSQTDAALFSGGLLLPGLIATLAALAPPPHRPTVVRTAIAALGGATIAAFVSWKFAEGAVGELGHEDALRFMVAHTLAAIATVGTILVAHRLNCQSTDG